MTMLGFVYHFVCGTCGALSADYPAYIFPDACWSTLHLPAWSRQHHCFATVILDLPSEARHELENDRAGLADLAESLSSATLTVGVPRMVPGPGGERIAVEIAPTPKCPHCGEDVSVRFGNPSDYQSGT